MRELLMHIQDEMLRQFLLVGMRPRRHMHRHKCGGDRGREEVVAASTWTRVRTRCDQEIPSIRRRVGRSGQQARQSPIMLSSPTSQRAAARGARPGERNGTSYINTFNACFPDLVAAVSDEPYHLLGVDSGGRANPHQGDRAADI